jgi:hypothetical protein
VRLTGNFCEVRHLSEAVARAQHGVGVVFKNRVNLQTPGSDNSERGLRIAAEHTCTHQAYSTRDWVAVLSRKGETAENHTHSSGSPSKQDARRSMRGCLASLHCRTPGGLLS